MRIEPEAPVSLTDMLAARENRARCQRQMLEKHGAPVLSFTLNTPGPVKDSRLYAMAFAEGMRLITAALTAEALPVFEKRENLQATGREGFFSVAGDVLTLKALVCDIEDLCEIGRFFDIDVIGLDGKPISRQDILRAERSCFLCGNSAAQCARGKTHSMEALLTFIEQRLILYFEEKIADDIASKAIRSLLYEVSVTPKPGLVDRVNNGAHSDMDFYTFLDNTAALSPYFRTCALAGLRSAGETPERLFQRLQFLGKRAEADMAEATSGVNTHKGAIFSLGVLCGAAGRVLENYRGCSVPALCRMSASIVSNAMKAYVQDTRPLRGARLETASGFETVQRVSLPMLRRQIAGGASENEAGIAVLLRLLAAVEDTNLCRRGGVSAQQYVSEAVSAHFQGDGMTDMAFAAALDEAMIERNLSPGGCADLLAITFFLYFMENEAR